VRVILGTNVFISAVFFSGPPYQILKGWRDRKIQLVVSPEILEEYQRVGEILAKQFPRVDLGPSIDLLAVEAKLVSPPPLPQSICSDPDDDKFLACALNSKAKLIVSGDKHLLNVANYRGIKIVRPRKFVDEYLTNREES
jgi:putative PIN family toxin of toxin-antitoxin system